MPDKYCPICSPVPGLSSDAKSVIRAARHVAELASMGRAEGALTLVCDEAGTFGNVIEAGVVRRMPYAASAAARRVADRLIWR